MKSKLVLIIALMLSCVFAMNMSAQNQKSAVSGTVIDDTGATLSGASVNVKGTNVWAVTDLDGKFTINAAKGDVLEFSYVGFKTQDVTVSSNTLNVALEVDQSLLDEVVFVGYGTQKKRDITGAIATMSKKDFDTQSSNNIQNLLQGRMAGVTVQTSGVSGQAPSIRIRGIGTLNSNTPLYVIDGIPTKSDVASQIDPSSIESLQVLKDAASASIYGAQASNGVILITTKQGHKGSAQFNVSANSGVRVPTNLPEMLNTQEYGEMLWTAYKNAGITPSHSQYGNGATPVIPDYILPAGASASEVDLSKYDKDSNQYMKANKEGTEWFKEIYRPARTSQINFNAAGGSDKGTYFTDINYLNEDQITKYAGYQKISVRNNATYHLNDYITVGSNLSASYAQYKGGSTNCSAAYMPAIVPVYDVMGDWAGTKASGVGDGTNPVANLYGQRNNYTNTLNILGDVYADVKFLKWFDFKSTAGVNLVNTDSKSFDPTTYWNRGDKNTLVNSLSQSHSGTTEVTWNNALTFDNTFGKHHVNVLAGTEAIWYDYHYESASRSNFLVEDVDYRYLSAGEDEKNNSGTGSQYRLFSLFARANYSYADKYYLTATIRRDGSSRFGENNKYGVFPSVSAAWRITGEEFMKNQNIFSDLKFRASYGVTGNQEISNYGFASTYGYDIRVYGYPISGNYNQISQGISQITIGNPDIRWETTTQFNVGLDMGFFDNSLVASVEWYNKDTDDILQQVSYPATAGEAAEPYQNIGSMNNKGWEVSLNYYSKPVGDFHYELGGVISGYKNKVTELAEHQFISNSYTRTAEGQPISSFFGYIVEGIYQTQEEVDSHAPWQSKTNSANAVGNWKLKDVNGDGVVNSNDRTFIGSPHPDFEYSLTGRAYFKNFDFMVYMQGTVGNDICNSSNYGQTGLVLVGGDFNKRKTILTDSWSPTNTKGTLPQLTTNLPGSSTQRTSYLIEDGSYFRIKNVELGYTLPSKIAKMIGLSRCRLYVNATNLLTITSYTGLDPEVRNTNDQNFGVDDMNRVPLAKVFTGGINLSF